MIGGYAAALLAAATVAGAAAAQEPAEAAQAELAAARANLAKAKTKPRWLSGPDLEIPEAERAQGHHGVVTVSGVLGEDGKLRQAYVKRSSGAPGLDALALEALQASVFEPARDAEGRALAVPMSVPQEFYSYKSNAPGGGLVRYGCRQFVLDMDWWRATRPDAKWGDHELYTMLLGMRALADISNAGLMKPEQLKGSLADFERRWVKAVEACRKHPDKRLNDVLQPEGRMADALSRAR